MNRVSLRGRRRARLGTLLCVTLVVALGPSKAVGARLLDKVAPYRDDAAAYYKLLDAELASGNWSEAQLVEAFEETRDYIDTPELRHLAATRPRLVSRLLELMPTYEALAARIEADWAVNHRELMYDALIAFLKDRGPEISDADFQQAFSRLYEASVQDFGRHWEEDAALAMEAGANTLWGVQRMPALGHKLDQVTRDRVYTLVLDNWGRIRSIHVRTTVARCLRKLNRGRAVEDFTAMLLAPDWKAMTAGATNPMVSAICKSKDALARYQRIAHHTRDPEVFRYIVIAREHRATFSELRILFDVQSDLSQIEGVPFQEPNLDRCWSSIADSLAVDASCTMRRHFNKLAMRMGPDRAFEFLVQHPDLPCPELKSALIDVVIRKAPTRPFSGLKPGSSLIERKEALEAMGLTPAQARLLESYLKAVNLLEVQHEKP